MGLLGGGTSECGGTSGVGGFGGRDVRLWKDCGGREGWDGWAVGLLGMAGLRSVVALRVGARSWTSGCGGIAGEWDFWELGLLEG